MKPWLLLCCVPVALILTYISVIGQTSEMLCVENIRTVTLEQGQKIHR